MDFKIFLQDKADDLINKATILPTIPIIWEECIQIKCGNLDKIIKTSGIKDFLERNKKRPAIYYFEIKSNETGEDIVERLQEYKSKNDRACPKIDKTRQKNSRILYCGSRKERLHERFIQHLGYGSSGTYALQLEHWAKDLNLELEFHFAWLDIDYKQFTELVESALADKLKPLVGKNA